MAPESSALAVKPTTTVVTTSPLSSPQTLRATTALLRKIQSDDLARPAPAKASLLADADDDETPSSSSATPVWLILTTKKHLTDRPRLKPGKIALPHPLTSLSSPTGPRVCLITADPQRSYKDLVASPAFPPAIAAKVGRVLGMEKLKKKYKSYESRRQLRDEYDVFLADDRVITYLPKVLGKVFYSSSSKRPVPVSLEGKRQNVDEAGVKRQRLSEGGKKVVKTAPQAADIAKEIQKAVESTLVHLAPSVTTAVKVGTAAMSPEEVQANVAAVAENLVEKYVPSKWRNVRALHVKGPETVALPVWMAEELWVDEGDVLEQEPTPMGKKRKAGALLEGLTIGEEEVLEVPGPDGKMRRVEKKKVTHEDGQTEVAIKASTKKRKSASSAEVQGEDEGDKEAKAAEKAEKAARKQALKLQKMAAKKGAAGMDEVDQKINSKAVANGGDEAVAKKAKSKRTKAADLI